MVKCGKSHVVTVLEGYVKVGILRGDVIVGFREDMGFRQEMGFREEADLPQARAFVPVARS